MNTILNIGLSSKHDLLDLNSKLAGFAPYSYEIHRNAAEWVVVARVSEPQGGVQGAVMFLARQLGQGYIAVYDETAAHGSLVGPNSALHGAFNPKRFIMPGGKFLA